MLRSKDDLTPASLSSQLDEFWDLSGKKIRLIRDNYDEAKGSPVFTEAGNYTTRGWTEWTQGFAYGAGVLQFDATDESEFLDYGRTKTVSLMAPHVSHFGVHDHGFNNVSTYGNLLRLLHEGRLPENEWERHFYEMALKISGAVQAKRWTTIPSGGFIYSFNGPHSLFVDTIRSCRALVVSHQLGHALMDEGDTRISLLDRAVQHARSTAAYSVFYDEGRDSYDTWGRTAHESVFNTNDGCFRCPNAQQGYTGFSTWTRGLAWAMCGFAEQLEFLEGMSEDAFKPIGNLEEDRALFTKAARATCDFYIAHSPTDGIPYWDTGAPGLVHLGDDYLD
ncbi:MAG: glycosyl hydrolase, partial [Verrucomicrobiota bacterium]